MTTPLQRFEGRKEFHAALFAMLTTLQNNPADENGLPRCETLMLIDKDFINWPLGDKTFCELLEQFLRQFSYRRLELLAHDFGHLEKQLPRFHALLRLFAHAIQCRHTSEEYRQLPDRYLITNAGHLVRITHPQYLRGETLYPSNIDDLKANQVWLSRFRQLYDAAEPIRLGLPVFD